MSARFKRRAWVIKSRLSNYSIYFEKEFADVLKKLVSGKIIPVDVIERVKKKRGGGNEKI